MPRAPEPDRPGIPELPAGLVGRATPTPGVAYLALRWLFRAVAWCLRLRIEVDGLAHLPRTPDGSVAGGWIAAGLPHRTWIDPFLLWIVLPARPRLVFFGDARTMARSPLRRWIVRRVGGILPIPSRGGPAALAVHLAAAADALAAGAVFCLFPESGQPVPPDRTRPIAAGIGYIALRTGAPIVPVVLGGTHELYLGRRILVRIQPALDAATLAGLAPGAARPEPGSHEERDAARAVAGGITAATAAAVARAFTDQEPPPGTRKRWRGLTTLFR